MLPDLWTTCDLPVLTELVRLLEIEGRHQDELPLAVDSLTEQQVEAGLRRLYGAGYIDGVTIDRAAHPIIVTSVNPRALQAVGVWPSPSSWSTASSTPWRRGRERADRRGAQPRASRPRRPARRWPGRPRERCRWCARRHGSRLSPVRHRGRRHGCC